MKIKHLLPLLAIAAAAPLANAVPAYPGLLKVTQPDGSTIEVYSVGDEHFNYFTDAKGEYILERNDKGFLVKAERLGEKMRPIQEHIDVLRAEQNAIHTPVKRTLGKLDQDGRALFPTSGETDCLILLVEYADRPFTEKVGYDDVRSYYNDFFNKKNFRAYDLEYSVIDYFTEVSGGVYKPKYEIAPVVTLPKDAQYYVGDQPNDRYRHWDEALSYALKELDGQIDYSKYDNDKDGSIDFVYIIYAGYGQADTAEPSTIWPHQGNLPQMTLDGVKTGPYACSNELRGTADYYQKTLRPAGIGTFCHEFGHVLGLPDLYDPNYRNNAYVPGKWSVMCNGCYNVGGTVPCTYTAYERWLCKWLEYEDLTDGTHYDLQPLTREAKAYRIPVINRRGSATSEYWLVENRTREGLDAGLPADGMILWYIYYSSTLWAQNSVNTNSQLPRCTVVAPSAIGEPKDLNDSGWIDGAYWPVLRWDGSLVDYIAPGTPDELVARGQVDTEKFHPMITGIKHDDNTQHISFDYNIMTQPTQTPDIKTVARIEGANRVYVEWAPVEGASSYIMTVTRTTAAGSTVVVDNLDFTDIGNTTNRTISNLTSTQMTQRMKIRIRPMFNGVPSSGEAVENCVPSELEIYDDKGVDTIDASVFISGGNGCVYAPAEAEVYNLAGIRTGHDNLPAGVYVVRYGSKICKVVVK